MSATSPSRKLHLIGIGGAGMSGLALAAQQLGAEVSGLRSRSIVVHRSDWKRLGCPSRSDTTRATFRPAPKSCDRPRSLDDNPELVAAREQRPKRVMHRSELLAELVANSKPRCIAVAGTHGKTTTTAMIAHVLDALGKDPSYFVGGEVTIGERTTNAHIGDGDVVGDRGRRVRRLVPALPPADRGDHEHRVRAPRDLERARRADDAFHDFAAPVDHVVDRRRPTAPATNSRWASAR